MSDSPPPESRDLPASTSPGASYTLEVAAQLVDVHPDRIRYYYQIGLLRRARVQNENDPVFDDNALYELRRIEHYRQHHGVNLHALPLIVDLLNEVERLRDELRFLRQR